MRRVLLSRLLPACHQHNNKLFSHLHKASIFHNSYLISNSPVTEPTKNNELVSKNHTLFNFKSHQSSENFNTLAQPAATNPPQLPSRQRKIQERSQLEEAFESAETTDDMLKALKEMEAVFDESELGLACLKMGLKLDQEGEDPEKILSFASRALDALDKGDKPSLPLAMSLQLLGSVCFGLQKFSDSLGYLNRANRVLVRLVESGCFSADQVNPILHAVQSELFNTKTAMGRREEALVNLKKALELKELMLEEDSVELGKANRDIAEAYVAVLNFKEALPCILKALDIHRAHLGNNSMEVANDRRLLGVIYTGLEEHEKALDQNQLSQRVLKNWGCSSDLLRGEIDASNMLIALGKYDEAINKLKNVIQQTEKESEDRAVVFISMGKAMCSQEKFVDSKRCLEMACGILDKKRATSDVAEAYIEISMQYEDMNDFEKAISLLQKAMGMLDKIPEEQHSVGSVSAKIGWLLLLTGKVEQAIPHLEDATERLKESFGSKHYAVGYVYNNLGAAYMELDRAQSAAQVFAYAKDIMEVALGPFHEDTVEACQNLSNSYAAMGSYQLAINFQEKVIEGWQGHGQSADDELEEATRVLKELKKKAVSSSIEHARKALPLPHVPSSRPASRLLADVSVEINRTPLSLLGDES